MPDVCQTYNTGNKCYVKRNCSTGKIIGNAKTPFDDVPIIGVESKNEVEPEAMDSHQSAESEHVEADQKEAAESVDETTEPESGGTFFKF